MPRAVQISRFGDPDVLEIVDVAMPTPRAGEVRIRVRTTGLNPADVKLRAGARPQLPLPAGLGSDLAGTVEACGPATAQFGVGDEVLGTVPMRAHAEYAIADVDGLIAKPGRLDWDVAGSLAVATRTAYRLLELLRVVDGETLLIHGASGAVGTMATQLARLRGATVLGTAGAANQRFLASLGATPVPHGGGLAGRLRDAAPSGVDAVLDASGRGELPISIELAGGSQRVVTIAAPDAAEHGVRFSSGDQGVDVSPALPTAVDALVRGAMQFPIWRTWPLTEVAAAHAASEQGHPPGKIVLRVGTEGCGRRRARPDASSSVAP